MSLGPNYASVLQAARVGAEWAWTQIYRDLAPGVLRYLTAQGAREPEDVLGEVFVSVVRSMPSFAGSENEFRAWVFKCAHNALIDSWRREGRRPVVYEPNEVLLPGESSDSAEAEVMKRLAYRRVEATLATLTQDQREVVFLRIVVGLSIEEVARIVGKSPGAVKSSQSRALAAIRRGISPEAVS